MYECTDTSLETVGWKYVGQTRDSIEMRHKGHKHGRCKFDSVLRANPGAFTLSIIETKTFEGQVSTHTKEANNADKANILGLAQDWMNEREINWIAHHGSYSNHGFNRDEGGRRGHNQAYFQAYLLDQERDWELRFRALSAYKQEHGDLIVPTRYCFPKTHPDTCLQGYTLGTVVSRIRTDGIKINDARRQRLTDEGFVWSIPEMEAALLELALLTFNNEFGHLIVPLKFVFPNNNAKIQLRGYKLGCKITSIRAGITKLTPALRRRLTALGFVWKDTQRHCGQLAMDEFYRIHGHSNIPFKYRFNDDYHVVALRGYRLSDHVSNLRAGAINVSAAERKRLTEMGFVWKPHEQKALLRLKALTEYKQQFGHIRVPYSFRFPMDYEYVQLQGFKLGQHVASLRSGNTKTSASDRRRLDEMGFVWRIRVKK